jgi:rhodanese-related sulfurtransferase
MDGWELIDVRSPAEHYAGAIPQSRNIPLDVMREYLHELGAGPFVVYCEVGQRGHTATALLHELGFKARNLDGGFQTWTAWTRAEHRL